MVFSAISDLFDERGNCGESYVFAKDHCLIFLNVHGKGQKPCLRDVISRDKIGLSIKSAHASLSAEYGAALEDVVPHHDDTGSDELGNHVVNASDVDEYPHEQLVEPESRDA